MFWMKPLWMVCGACLSAAGCGDPDRLTGRLESDALEATTCRTANGLSFTPEVLTLEDRAELTEVTVWVTPSDPGQSLPVTEVVWDGSDGTPPSLTSPRLPFALRAPGQAMTITVNPGPVDGRLCFRANGQAHGSLSVRAPEDPGSEFRVHPDAIERELEVGAPAQAVLRVDGVAGSMLSFRVFTDPGLDVRAVATGPSSSQIHVDMLASKEGLLLAELAVDANGAEVAIVPITVRASAPFTWRVETRAEAARGDSLTQDVRVYRLTAELSDGARLGPEATDATVGNGPNLGHWSGTGPLFRHQMLSSSRPADVYLEYAADCRSASTGLLAQLLGVAVEGLVAAVSGALFGSGLGVAGDLVAALRSLCLSRASLPVAWEVYIGGKEPLPGATTLHRQGDRVRIGSAVAGHGGPVFEVAP
ncbi:MAG: hypothetical protein ACFB9M_12905 [Myxococcota bacterium]